MQPTLFHRSLRWFGLNFPRVKGINWALRRMHPPGPQLGSPLATEIRAIWDGPRFHVDTRSYLEWLVYFYGSQSRPMHQWIRKHVMPEWVCMDVGMNFGFITCLFAQRSHWVHAFEPVDSLVERARSNCALNKFTNVTINRLVLSDRDGETEFNLPNPNTGNWGTGSLVYPQMAGTVRIPSITMDRYCDEHQLKRLDVVKIDVEGAEALVLSGAINTLQMLRPCILFEKNAGSLSECAQILKDSAYRLFDLRGRPFRPSMVTDRHCADLVAMPAG